MVPFLAGCNTVSSQGTESQSSDSSSTDHNSVDNTTLIEEENINAGTRSESELLDTFLKEGKKYGNLYDWTRFLGIPDEALSVYSEISELLEDPQKTLEEYFERIPNIDNARPQRGDMVLIKPSDTWKMGVGGIATGVERIEGEAIFEDVLLPMNWEKPESHKITEFLGWLRPRIPDSNGSIAVQGEDTGLEGGEFGQKYLK
ncbi:MAG: hypothetical protein HYT09_01890 [Candidatus Levybacteria bacterium]|nr:hypothetical protein [Candidatus Levybacteria bacterium]